MGEKTMPQDYAYDIFISYRHKGPAYSWVTEYFHPLLEQWLPESVPVEYDVKIFIDSQIETGAEWPAKLRQALRTSRCLLPILSPEYFRSKWCQAELQTMRQREQVLGLRTEENSSGLIYAVVFASPDLLPAEVQNIERKDMSDWATTYSDFRNSKNCESFEREMKLVCKELPKMLQRAPAWQDWPVVTPPEPPQRVPVALGQTRL
jgi:hypothetical protein